MANSARISRIGFPYCLTNSVSPPTCCKKYWIRRSTSASTSLDFTTTLSKSAWSSSTFFSSRDSNTSQRLFAFTGTPCIRIRISSISTSDCSTTRVPTCATVPSIRCPCTSDANSTQRSNTAISLTLNIVLTSILYSTKIFTRPSARPISTIDRSNESTSRFRRWFSSMAFMSSLT